MFKPLSLYIGLRYTRAKKRNHFISFIALTSIAGIALSVTVLITVLSVMNGFGEQIKDRVLVMARQISLIEKSIHFWVYWFQKRSFSGTFMVGFSATLKNILTL